MLDSPHFESIVQQLSEQADKHQEAIVSIAQRLQDKGERIGWENGHQSGIIQGIEQERLRAYQRQLEMARHLLKNGINIELVIESTGLSREELTEIS